MKRIIIIGASSGIGLKSALIFASMGWKVGLAARRIEPLQTVKNQYPGNVEFIDLDVDSGDSPDKLETLIGKLGGMDVFFNVAGVGWANPLLETERDVKTVETNAVGFVRMVDTAYRYFSQNGGGQIAAITSVAGTKGIGVSASYSATKRFQSTYLEALSQLSSIDGFDLRVTDIRPGFIRTALLDPSRSYPLLMDVDYATKRVVEAIVKRRHVAYIDWRWRLVVTGWKLIPSWLWRRLKIKL